MASSTRLVGDPLFVGIVETLMMDQSQNEFLNCAVQG